MKGALRALPLALILVAGCKTSPQIVSEKVDKAENGKAIPDGNCTSRAVVDAIRDKAFDAAVAKVGEKEAVKLNSLRSVIAGRLENPVVASHDPALERTECSGKIVFGLPPNTQRAFNGATQLSSDISFSTQPAADKSGLVVEATGLETLVDSLVQGAQRKRVVRVGAPEPAPSFDSMFNQPPKVQIREFGSEIEPMPSGGSPSFSCKAKLSRVERMVCDEPGLAAQDQLMAEAYRDAVDRTAPDARARLESLRMRYLSQRNRCADSACVAATYDAWTSALYEWEP